MKMYKYLVGLVTSIMLMTVLVGCGTDKEVGSGKSEETNGTVKGEQTEIVAGSLKTEIQKGEGAEYQYVFSIQNDTEKEQTLVYPSSQEYDYAIKTLEGKTLYTFGMDKSFLQTTKEVGLKPGEKLEFDINLMEGLQTIPSGKYKVEIWATVQNNEDLKSEIEIEYQAPASEGKQVVHTTVPVTYVGQIDGNSIEVKNEEGLPEVYRLTEVTKEQVNNLTENNVITIEYTIDSNGLRVAQVFTVVSE